MAIGVAALLGACGGEGDGAPSGGRLRFVDASAESGLPLAGATSGAVFVDLDGDRSRDLLIGRHDLAPEAFRNRGHGRFEPVPGWGAEMTVFDHHATVADDLDGDGALDFYFVVGAHRGEGSGANGFFAGHDSPRRDTAGRWDIADPYGRGRGALLIDADADGAADLFVLNFRTAPRCFALGVEPPATDLSERRLGMPPADDAAVADGAARTRGEYVTTLLPVDIEGDRRTDYLALGGGLPLKLLRTDTIGVRIDVPAIPPAAYLPEPRAAAWGDIDGDGRPDLFLVYGADDQPSHFDAERRNRLLLQRDGRFEDHTPPGLAGDGRGVACVAVDLDHDGALDLAVLRTRGDRRQSRVLLYRNLGGDPLAFDTAVELGPFPGIGESLLADDLDADGDVDLLVINGAVDVGSSDGGVRLLLNTGARNHWLAVAFEAGLPYGAVVEVTAGGGTQTRQFWPTQVGGSAYRGVLRLGLGEAVVVDRLRITWPDGREARFTDLAAERTIRAVPGP